MTFTRTTDSVQLEPDLVFGPYQHEREVRNFVVPLLESSNVRVVYSPTGLRTGTLMLLLSSYADAIAAAEFFAVASSFNFDGPMIDGGYIISDGMVVWDGVIDDTFDMRFIAHGGSLRVVQNDPAWELHVPFHELIEA